MFNMKAIELVPLPNNPSYMGLESLPLYSTIKQPSKLSPKQVAPFIFEHFFLIRI